MSFYKLFGKTVKSILKKQSYSVSLTQQRYFKDVKFEDIPDVSLSGIKTHLRKHDVRFEEHFTNFSISCPICEPGLLAEKTKIFINKRTGAFTCETCLHTGSWTDMSTYVSAKKNSEKDRIVVRELDKLNNYIKTITKNTLMISELSEENYAEMLNKFQLPDVIKQTVMASLDVRLDITRSVLYFPLLNSANEVVGFKVLRTKSTSIEPKLLNTASSGVIVHKPLKGRSKTAVIVADVADYLVLVNAELSHTIICLPNGLVGLSQHVLPCFEAYNKLILWLGNDLQSWEISREYAKKLIEKRCLFIKLVDKVPSPHIQPEQDFKAIISKAQTIWHKSITTFASLRDDVLSDLQNMDKVQGVKWTRYPSLNRILKGHRRGELTVFTGPTGSGKTTFISDYSLDLAMQGVNTLWGSFEIRNVRLARTMLQQMAGFPFDENLEKYDYWADLFEQLPIYYMTFHGQESIKVVMEAIEHATYVHDISHVIIDNLQFMMGMSEDGRNMDRFWKQDLIIASFRTFATRRNCHVTLVIHPRKEKDDEDLTMSSIFGGAKASQESDNIMIIQDKRLAAIKGKKYLQVAKNRYSGDLGIIPLDFDKDSLSFAPKKRKSDEKKSDKPKRSEVVKT